MKRKIFTLAIIALLCNKSVAQTTWNTRGNTISNLDWIGSDNYEGLIFKTNNIQRGKFDADGKFIVDGAALFNKGIKTDSIRIVKYLDVDSIETPIYSYSLIVDGQMIDSKKMVKQN